ncbi:trypsin-1-like [Lytechinus pictus]|uniref:trypsin-1-like n=1 Tax=Lytechinus pictus TaxID=7653 RepID=UPI0030B9E339
MLRFFVLACALGAIQGGIFDPPKDETCGKPAITPLDMSTFIVGGHEAKPNSWPWMTQVIKYSYTYEYWYHYCGATLLNENWIVSAAHCFDDNDMQLWDYLFYVGAHERTRWGESTRQMLEAEEIILHPGYNPLGDNDHDIALIKIKGSVQMNSYVSPACIASDRPANGEDSYVTGWGNLESGGDSPDALYQVMVPIVSDTDCKRAYGGITYNPDYMICAGLYEGGKDSCQGDSGGPLVVKNTGGQWELAGVVSFGKGCAERGYYGVYTNVANYYDWIQSYIN